MEGYGDPDEANAKPCFIRGDVPRRHAVGTYSVRTWAVRRHGRPLAVLVVLGSENAVFIPHSNGRYVAQAFPFRQPERVQVLAIADGTCVTWSHSATEMSCCTAAPRLWQSPEKDERERGRAKTP